MIAVCSRNAPARTQNNHSKGHQWWARDVWHIAPDLNGRTLCGRDASDWIVIAHGPGVEIDHHCCERCKAKHGA